MISGDGSDVLVWLPAVIDEMAVMKSSGAQNGGMGRGLLLLQNLLRKLGAG